MSEMVPVAVSPGLPLSTMARLEEANAVIRGGNTDAIIDVLLYTDALVSVAREKRAMEVARAAARTRIDAARRIGELIQKSDDPDVIWNVVPTRFDRCDQLAAIPTRLFSKVTASLISGDGACTIAAVIRKARIESLQRVETGIYVAFDGTYWIAEGGGKSRSHIHRGGIEEARRRLGLRDHPNASGIDNAYSTARIAASSLSQLGAKLTGETRRLVGEAELAQARVAELLDQALKALA